MSADPPPANMPATAAAMRTPDAGTRLGADYRESAAFPVPWHCGAVTADPSMRSASESQACRCDFASLTTSPSVAPALAARADRLRLPRAGRGAGSRHPPAEPAARTRGRPQRRDLPSAGPGPAISTAWRSAASCACSWSTTRPPISSTRPQQRGATYDMGMELEKWLNRGNKDRTRPIRVVFIPTSRDTAADGPRRGTRRHRGRGARDHARPPAPREFRRAIRRRRQRNRW